MSRSEKMKAWWASRTEEQRREIGRKVVEGRANPPQKVLTGPVCGVNHKDAKLTDDKVREIYFSDDKPADLAARYGVSLSTVQKILDRKIWKHLRLPDRPRIDRRYKTGQKPATPKAPPPPVLTPEQKEAILASPYLDTRKLADQLGVHWMAVATFRNKQMRGGLW